MNLSSLFKKRAPRERFYSTENQFWYENLYISNSEELYAQKAKDGTWSIYIIKGESSRYSSWFDTNPALIPVYWSAKTRKIAEGLTLSDIRDKLREHEEQPVSPVSWTSGGGKVIQARIVQISPKAHSWRDIKDDKPPRPRLIL